jgi:CxxC-x17-CxxC domain-containing protein
MIDMRMQDATRTCGKCGQVFTISAGEQVAYARRGQSSPAYCAFCRAAGMIASGAHPAQASNDPHERSDHAMYLAVCDQCGKQTKVPFEPRGGRPVFCSNCYRDQQRTSGGRYDGGAQGRKSSSRRG